MNCPLCSFSARYLASGENREYWLCSKCLAIFVPDRFHISQDEEVQRYLEHENSIENEGYVQMFQKKISILQENFPQIKSALDFGCGYEPVLKTLLERQGIMADGYDPNFFPDLRLDKRYDLVISTETFEHFRNPAKEVQGITDRVIPGGLLAIMTRFYPTGDNGLLSDKFADWYYKRDPTHIIFYCSETFKWLAKSIGFEMVFNNNHDFVVLKKPRSATGCDS
jgi:SAM-dependent methyltransferase